MDSSQRMQNACEEPVWDETTDVIIVGSGFAGLSAAYEAAKRSHNVIILEKMSYCGGNSRIAGGGYCCWDSKLKLREELDLGSDSWQSHYEDTLKAGGGYNSPELVEVLAKEAPEGLDFLVDAGIPFRKTLPRIGGHSAYRSYQIACSGSETIEKLTAAVLESGNVEIHKKAKVQKLIRAHGERVGGVSVEIDGFTQHIHATCGVIIASGGYAQDLAIRTVYKPSLTSSYNCTNHRGATGEMITLARSIGADVLHMEFLQLYPCADPANGSIDQAAFLCYSGTGYGIIYVTDKGFRFVNELESREHVSNAQILSGSSPTYTILNDEIFSRLGIKPEEIEALVRRRRALQAATIDELATHAGFAQDIFSSTVIQHNEAIKKKLDPVFRKPMTEQMVPLTDGRFYAIPQWPSVHYSMGGLRIDRHAHVIDIWGKPIPGLYAAGEVCGGVHGIDRLGGNGIAECIVFGRIAGCLY